MAGFKSDENKQLFIKGLREANFTQEEIDREVQDIEGAPAKAAPADSSPPPAKKEDAVVSQPSPFALDTAAPARQLKEMGQSREEQGKTLVDNITPTGGFWPPSKENWPVYALPAAAAAVTAAGLGLKSRFFGPEKEAGARVEPTSSDRLPAAAQQPTTHEQWIANLSPEEKTLYERSEEAKAVRANALQSTRNEPFLEPERPVVAPEIAPQTPEEIRQARQVAATQAIQQSMVAAPPPEAAPLQRVEPPTERPVNPKVSALLQPSMAGAAAPPPALVEPVVAPVAPVETVATTPTPAATDAERVQAIQTTEEPAVKATNNKVLETVKEQHEAVKTAEATLGKPDVKTGSGMPAYQGQGEEGGKVVHKKGTINSLKDIPKNMVFVPGGQNMDIVRNAVGQPEYTKNLKSAGGYPESPQGAYETSRNINKSLGRASIAEAKASGIALPEPTQSITQKIAGSKTVRLGGITGALILATDVASAATTGESILANMAKGFSDAVKNKDYGLAASQAAELLNFHPYTLLANQLFGSSPEELKILREADQAKKAGGTPLPKRK
jgi:hypothetical protein